MTRNPATLGDGREGSRFAFPRSCPALLAVPATVVVLLAMFLSDSTSAASKDGSASAAKAQEPAHRFTLSNGLPVVYRRNTHNQVFSLRLYIQGGRRWLSPETQGITALWLATATRGSENYSRDRIDEILEPLGAEIGGGARPDLDFFALRCLGPDLDPVLAIFADALLHPTLAESELRIVRDRMIVGAKQRRENPDFLLAQGLNERFFKGHPYRFDENGTPESLPELDRAKVLAHKQRLVRAGHMVLTAVGPLPPNELKIKLEAALSAIPPGGEVLGMLPAISESERGTIAGAKFDSPTYYVLGRFPTVPANHPDAPLLELAMAVLRNELWDEVRTKRGLTYAVSASAVSLWQGYAGLYVTATDPDATLRVMLHTLQRLKDAPVAEKKVRSTAAQYETDFYLSREANMEQAATLGWAHVYLGDADAGDAYMAAIRKATAVDVQRVLRTYAKAITWQVLGREPDDEKIVPRDAFTLPAPPLPERLHERNFSPVHDEGPGTSPLN